jgi:hypothetical protein
LQRESGVAPSRAPAHTEHAQRMKYLIAIVLPPPGQEHAERLGLAILCLILQLTVLGWPLAAIWAVLVVNNAENDARTRRLIKLEAKKAR